MSSVASDIGPMVEADSLLQAIACIGQSIRRYWNGGLHAPAPGGRTASLAQARARRLLLELRAQLHPLQGPQAARLADQLVAAAQRVALEEWRRDRRQESDREALLYCLREELLDAWRGG